MMTQRSNLQKSLTVFVFLTILHSVTAFQCTEKMYQNYLNHWQRDIAQQKLNDDYVAKFNTYCKKLERVITVNSQDSGHKEDQFSRFLDKTDEEMKKILKVSKIPDQIFGQKVNKADEQNLIKVSADLPASLDWRVQGGVSSIKNQQNCGACWAFTTTALYESFLMLKGEQEYDLSEQYILQCTTPYVRNIMKQQRTFGCDAGGNSYFANELVRVNGIPLQSKYPYVAGDFDNATKIHSTIPGICSANQTYLYAKDPSVTKALYKENMTHEQMKTLLVKSPVAVMVYADDGFTLYSSGVYKCPTTEEESIKNINHAILVVGYTAEGNYIIKNSWDTKWGQDGFGILDKDSDCAIRYVGFYFQSDAPSGNGLVYSNQVNLYPKSGFKLSIFMTLVLIILAFFY